MTLRHRKQRESDQREGEGEVGQILGQRQGGHRDPARPRGRRSVGLQVHDLTDGLWRERIKRQRLETVTSAGSECACVCVSPGCESLRSA